MKRLVRTYVKKRLEQKEAMNKELGRLKQLPQNESIDQLTFERLKHLLEHAYEQKRVETMEQYTSSAAKKPSPSHTPA